MTTFDGWAEYYDLIHQGLPGEAEFYVGQAVRARGSVLELGCGTGRLLIPMAMSGVNAVGVDNSKSMLSRCREKKRAVGKTSGLVKLVHADMVDLELGQTFDLIIMAYRTFMHVLTPEEQCRCLSSVRRHLDKDGRFILNLWSAKPSRIAAFAKEGGGVLQLAGRYPYPASEGTLLHFCSTTYDEHQQLIIEEHVLHEVNAKGTILRSVTLPLIRAWITPREMDHLLHRCGFAVEALFGDFDCRPHGPDSTEMIWVLRPA